jgi:hypothetical protein
VRTVLFRPMAPTDLTVFGCWLPVMSNWVERRDICDEDGELIAWQPYETETERPFTEADSQMYVAPIWGPR